MERSATDAEVINSLEEIVKAGVAITAEALVSHDGANLTLPMWRVVVILGDGRDGATVTEVARRIGVTVPATSRQLRRLATRGLVSLELDKRDHRAVRAHLSDAGVRFLEHVLARRRSSITEALGGFIASAQGLHEIGQIAVLLRHRDAGADHGVAGHGSTSPRHQTGSGSWIGVRPHPSATP